MLDSTTQAVIDRAFAAKEADALTRSQAALLRTYEWWLEEQEVSKIIRSQQ